MPRVDWFFECRQPRAPKARLLLIPSRISRSGTIFAISGSGRVSRASPGVPAVHNGTRDEGGPFVLGNQVPISSHRKLLWSKAMVVSVAETPGQDSGRHGRERRAQANRCRSVESGLGDVRTGG